MNSPRGWRLAASLAMIAVLCGVAAGQGTAAKIPPEPTRQDFSQMTPVEAKAAMAKYLADDKAWWSNEATRRMQPERKVLQRSGLRKNGGPIRPGALPRERRTLRSGPSTTGKSRRRPRGSTMLRGRCYARAGLQSPGETFASRSPFTLENQTCLS